MEGDNDLRRRREELLAGGDWDMICYSLIGTFSTVEELAEYLQHNQETRFLNVMNARVDFVHCYLNFILQQEENVHELARISFYALNYGHVSLLRLFPQDYNFFDRSVAYFIHISVATQGYVDVLMFLIERGLLDHPEVRDKCLRSAVVNKKIDIVRLLLDGGADANYHTDPEDTVIIVSIRHSNVEILMLLVSQGGDVYSRPDLMWKHAAIRGDRDILFFLQGMNVPIPDNIIQVYLAYFTFPYRFGVSEIDGTPLQTLQRVLGILREIGAQEPVSLDDVHLLPRHLETLELA